MARCSRGGNRLSGKGQACELSAHHVQPPELRAFILGNNVGFIFCENGGGKKRRRGEKKGVGGGGVSCSESCTSRDHLSALIESQGGSAGGDARPGGPDKHTHTYTFKGESGRPLKASCTPAQRRDVRLTASHDDVSVASQCEKNPPV